ncbi:hypothetical protein ACET3Z_011335 [Daucus carota]
MFRRQAKIVNPIDSDCPRLNNNNNNLVVRRFRRFFKWCGRNVTVIPRVPVPRIRRIKKSKHKSRLPGFFHSQLRMMKGNTSSLVRKKSKKHGSLEKTKCLINYQVRNRLRIHDLPKELLAEILVRLPVKDILRCRSVKKSWNYLVISPVFISLQLNYQKQIATGNYNHHYPKYLLFHEDDSLRLTVRVDDLQCEEYCKLKFLPGLPNDDVNVWFALSYGLICMSTILFTSCDRVNLDKQRTLLCFDTKTDILCAISLPDWVAYLPLVPVIHQFGQSMAYFVWDEVNYFDMWVLKHDHINEFTWEKKMCVTPSIHVEEEVLGVRNNGDPILAKSNNLISYSLESHQANGFVNSWDRWTPNSPYNVGKRPPYVIRPFVESLVLLND